MNIHTNIPLKSRTTMQLGGPARFFTEIHTIEEVVSTYKSAVSQQLPFFVLGGGSNIIVHDEGFSGIVLHMRIPGFDIIEDTLYDTTIKIGAGESWDAIVARTIELELSGIETMSNIPGTAGAAPVQNIGAYGQEIADTLVELEAYDTKEDRFVVLSNAECGFSYRHSRFRGDDMGRFIVTSITLKLSKTPLAPPFYDSLQAYFDQHAISLYTKHAIRDAVIAIRTSKLPDPTKHPNAGSFFKNAIIESWLRDDLLKVHSDMPSYDMGNGTYKIPTGWLIEKVGLKGQLLHGMRVHDGNALVLINESAAGYADLNSAREEIAGYIRDTFRIAIEQEPLEL